MVQRKNLENMVTIELGTRIEAAEQILITKTLEHVKDNKAKAARLLGVSRKTLYDKLKCYEAKY
jgi:two-component system response regulator HydG